MPDKNAMAVTENSIYQKSNSATNQWKSIEGNTATASGSGGALNSQRDKIGTTTAAQGISISGPEHSSIFSGMSPV